MSIVTVVLAEQDRMHLDCVFSILGDKCCIMLEEMLGAESKTRRLVDEYSRHPTTGPLDNALFGCIRGT